MTRLLLSLLITLMAGCSTLADDSAPACHGARRPANPYGSVLAPTAAVSASDLAIRPASGACGRTSR